MEESTESLKRCHTYAKPPVEAETSPSSSPQKKTLCCEPRSEPSNAVLLAAINKLTESIENNFKSIQMLFTSVQAVEERVVDLTSRVDPLELQIKSLSAENKKLLERSDDMDAYSRRWNLKIFRTPETEGENMKMMVFEIFLCLTWSRDSLQTMVDFAHRLVPRLRREG